MDSLILEIGPAGTCAVGPAVEPAPVRGFSSDNVEDILRFAVNEARDGRVVALATLADIRGGSARPLGTHMAVRDDGVFCGYVSGGCTEAAVAAEAVQAIRSGADRILLLGAGSPFFDVVLPCGGGISIFIHVIRDYGPIENVLERLRERRRCSLIYRPDAQDLTWIVYAGESGWRTSGFVTSYRPRPRLIVSAHSADLSPAADIATAAGYEVFTHGNDVVKPATQIDADTAIALLYHDLDRELPVLVEALASNAFYIGALGSARTHARRVEKLQTIGVSEGDIARIKGPIGIFGKAGDSGSLALSIVADVAAIRNAEKMPRLEPEPIFNQCWGPGLSVA
ncbi:XdhC family protein [Rhizobium leguminosarum]|uniref:XdhC family protein n=1 Tax=Rhizobium leguminosarum TaxID=384 RepID=A0ACD5FEC3_RHILE